MTISDAIRQLTKLRVYYPQNQVKDETLALYAAEMTEHDEAHLALACRRLAKSSKWFPALSEILDELKEVRSGHASLLARIERLKLDVAAYRAQLTSGCPKAIIRLPEAFATGKSRTVGISSMLGENWVGIEHFGGQPVPKDLSESEEAAWRDRVEKGWKSETEARLANAESSLAFEQGQCDKFLGGKTVPLLNMGKICS